jgi:anaerobic magnesium-protoporphyrin IX monomethyl ester cyclase
MITLINPPGLKTFSGLNMHTPNPPIGLAYVAATLKEAGRPYTVIDATGEALDAVHPYPDRTDFMVQGLSIDEVVERLPGETDVIGLSCMFSTLWPLARRVAEGVRAGFPDALIVLGGEHGTAVPEHVLQNSPVDVVVLGEGEETFLKLLAARDAGTPLTEVSGIAVRRDDGIVNTGLSPRERDVDSVPLPDWDSFPIMEYVERHQINGINIGRSMPILGTRGCPFKCTFCSNPGMWTQRWIPRNPKLLADEMELYHAKYGATNFDFQDLTAIVKRQWIVDFTSELIERDLNFTWQMPSGTRSEVFDAEIADMLYRSGCRALAFAPESGSEEILKAVKKEVDLDHMLVAMRAAVKRGLKLSCFIVVGFPQDTPKTHKQSLKLIRKMARLGVHDVAVSKFVPYPGSQLFKQLQAAGKLKLDDEFFVSPMDFYTDKAPSYSDAVSTKKLYRTMLWMYVNFYVISFAFRPMRVVRVLTTLIVKGTEETRYAKWFADRLFVRRRWRRIASQSNS